MEAGQSISALSANLVGRAKFDVTIHWKNGEKQFFSDAAVHHMDGWLLVSEYHGEHWHSRVTSGFRGDEIKSYRVEEHTP